MENHNQQKTMATLFPDSTMKYVGEFHNVAQLKALKTDAV